MPEETAPPTLVGNLTPFEGHEVTQSKVEIRKIGGGLQEALKFDPVEIAHGEEHWVAVKVRCDEVRFDPIKASDCLARVHIFSPMDDQVAFLDDDPKLVKSVEKHIGSRTERIKKAREEQAGIMRLLEGDGGEAEAEAEAFGHEPGEAEVGEKGDPDGDDQWENG